MSLFRRLRDTVFSRRYETELDDEIRSHVEMRARDLEAQGLPPEDARLAARRRFGNATLARERARESDTFAWLYSVFQDLRYGLRIMRKTPLVTGFRGNMTMRMLCFTIALALLPRTLAAAERPDDRHRQDLRRDVGEFQHWPQ